MAKGDFELYKDRKGEFRWRLTATNGNIIASSGEGYATEANAKRAATTVQTRATKAKIVGVPAAPAAAPKVAAKKAPARKPAAAKKPAAKAAAKPAARKPAAKAAAKPAARKPAAKRPAAKKPAAKRGR